MYLKFSFFILILMSVLSSCEVKEGEGGSATIKGRLMLEQYNDDFSLLVRRLPAGDENVYIQYGNKTTVSDDVETSFDGYFEFNYLYEGDYTVFYYSMDSADQLAPEKEVILKVNLAKGEEKDLGELTYFETLDFDEGEASISGRVYEVIYNKYAIVEDTILALEKEVYLRSDNHIYFDDRIRTQEDGAFYFENLLPGAYTVYVISEDTLRPNYNIPITKHISISENLEVIYDLGNFFVHNF